MTPLLPEKEPRSHTFPFQLTTAPHLLQSCSTCWQGGPSTAL